jgi:hypothetical protein
MKPKEHNTKLLLQGPLDYCPLCNKLASEHNGKLWEIHRLAVQKGQYCPEHNKREKFYPITTGFGKIRAARVCRINAEPPYDMDLIPIYTTCSECGKYLGDIEEEHPDVLDGMCLVCFSQLTGLEENSSHLGVGYPKEIKPVQNIWSGKMVSMGPIESTGTFYPHSYSIQDILDRVKEKRARKMTDQPGGYGE